MRYQSVIIQLTLLRSPSSPLSTISCILLYTQLVRWLNIMPKVLPALSAAAFISFTALVYTPAGFSQSTCRPFAKASFASTGC